MKRAEQVPKLVVDALAEMCDPETLCAMYDALEGSPTRIASIGNRLAKEVTLDGIRWAVMHRETALTQTHSLIAHSQDYHIIFRSRYMWSKDDSMPFGWRRDSAADYLLSETPTYDQPCASHLDIKSALPHRGQYRPLLATIETMNHTLEHEEAFGVLHDFSGLVLAAAFAEPTLQA